MAATATSPANFAHEIGADYGVELPFFDGSLAEARQMAELSGKYVLVYLHCPTHEDTETFLSQTLTSPAVQAAVLDKVVLFGLSVMTSEGQRFAAEHHVCAYPALVGLFQQREMIRFEGDWCRDEAGLLREWEASTGVWDTQMAQDISARAERESREAARLSEQNALAEMEREDIRRLQALEEREQREAEARQAAEMAAKEAAEAAERERQEAAAEAERQRLEAEARARVVQSRQQTVTSAQLAARARLPEAPPDTAPAEDVCLISVKSLVGKQNARRFWRSDLVESVYDFALAEEDVEALVKHLESLSDDVVNAPQRWLQLAAGFPPVTLAWERGSTTCGEVRALCPRATVLVRKMIAAPA